MVEILLDRADSGSVANILVGDMIVVRVHDTDARRWAVEDAGSLRFHSAERATDAAALPGERVLRFRAAAPGATTLRLGLGQEGDVPREWLVFEIEVHEQQPSSARLLRKRS